MAPLFAIDPAGIRFCIFGDVHWPYAQIESIDVHRGVFGTQVIIKSHMGQQLRATVGSDEAVRGLLLGMPSDALLTKGANEYIRRYCLRPNGTESV